MPFIPDDYEEGPVEKAIGYILWAILLLVLISEVHSCWFGS